MPGKKILIVNDGGFGGLSSSKGDYDGLAEMFKEWLEETLGD
jgi:hypothetical protein